MKVDPLICAITICRLSDEFSKNLSRMTKTFLVETPNGCVQCGFPGCFWVSVKPFLPVSLGSHHRDFPLEINRVLPEPFAPKDFSGISLDAMPSFFSFASVSLPRVGTQPGRGWADRVALGTTKRLCCPSRPTRKM